MKRNISKRIRERLDYAKEIAYKYPDETIKTCKELLLLAKDNGLKLEEGHLYNCMFLAYRAKTDVVNMLDNSLKALSIFETEDDLEGKMRSLNFIGITYFYSSIYEEALKSFLKIEALLDNNNNSQIRASVLNNIGEVYREARDFDKAMEYYNKAQTVSEDIEDKTVKPTILSNIGEIHFEKGEYDKALEIYRKIYEDFLDNKDMINLGEIEIRIGKVYYQLGDLKRAEGHYKKSFEILDGIENKYYKLDLLMNMAKLYEETDEDKALYYYEMAIKTGEKTEIKKKLCDLYRIVSEYHERKENYLYALDFYKKHTNIKEEITNFNLNAKLELLKIELKNLELLGKHDEAREKLEEELKKQNEELERIRQANKTLETKVFEDDLTGIANRRSINIYLNQALMGLSKEEILCLFMIDIDDFKNYNDYWGHSEGDNCLKAIASEINRIKIERNDNFARYGGEEFVYISILDSYYEALRLGNRIRKSVEDLGLYYINGNKRKPVTISVGGVIGNIQQLGSLANIMILADNELYSVKESGKNKTFIKEL